MGSKHGDDASLKTRTPLHTSTRHKTFGSAAQARAMHSSVACVAAGSIEWQLIAIEQEGNYGLGPGSEPVFRGEPSEMRDLAEAGEHQLTNTSASYPFSGYTCAWHIYSNRDGRYGDALLGD
jgi:hypothetical protein